MTPERLEKIRSLDLVGTAAEELLAYVDELRADLKKACYLAAHGCEHCEEHDDKSLDYYEGRWWACAACSSRDRAQLARKDEALLRVTNALEIAINWMPEDAEWEEGSMANWVDCSLKVGRADLSPSPSEAPAPPAETLAAMAPLPPDVLVAALSDLPPHTGKLLWSRPIGAPLPIAPPPDYEAEARIDALVAAQPQRGNRRPLPAEPAPQAEKPFELFCAKCGVWAWGHRCRAEPAPRETAETATPNVAPRRQVSQEEPRPCQRCDGTGAH